MSLSKDGVNFLAAFGALHRVDYTFQRNRVIMLLLVPCPLPSCLRFSFTSPSFPACLHLVRSFRGFSGCSRRDKITENKYAADLRHGLEGSIAQWAPATIHKKSISSYHMYQEIGVPAHTIVVRNCNNTAVCVKFAPHIYIQCTLAEQRRLHCVVTAHCVRNGHRSSSTESVLHLFGTGPNLSLIHI